MRGDKELHIFDFFSGPGYDSNSIPGTPIRLLQKINEQLGNILQKKTKIVLHLNELNHGKFYSLKKNCENFIAEYPKFKYFLTVNYYNENAEDLFFKLADKIKKYPSLVYLDQNGVKFISKEYIEQLEQLETTDFLYFVSSSYFVRLGATKEFKEVLQFEPEELQGAKYSNIHRIVLDKIKSVLPENSELKLFPFSIKKGANIYGIIFGAKHYRAVDKFLKISWKRNELNGEADFDIDDDQAKRQLDLFGSKKMTKIEKFKHDLKFLILNGKIRNNVGALKYTYETGNFYKHANDLLRQMKKEVSFEGRTPGINYDCVFKPNTKRTISYTLNKKS